MIRQINRVTAVLLVFILALIANVSYLQVFKADEYRNQAGNQRMLLSEYSRERGAILIGSATIAQSVPTDDTLKYLRTYEDGATYAAITGFYSMIYGASGLESTENSVLAGNDSRFFVDRFQQLIAGRKPKGGAIRLTINSAAQEAAMKALDGRTGAVVALDPQTGAILALASSPSFDPNVLSSHDAANIQENYEALNSDEAQPMLNRALNMTLPPGSVFKLVTAAAALESGQYDAKTEIPGPRRMDLPLSDKTLGNWNDKSCGTDDITNLKSALAISCNTAFALLGIELGASTLADQAEKFGFESTFEIPLSAATSRFPSNLDDAQTAMSAIGQFDVRATPLQMAMVVAAIANNGVLMQPYIVDQILGPDLNVLESTTPRQIRQAVSEATADSLLDLMVNVVENGTGSNAQISGVSVGGKTGTAENDPNEPAHAWFVSVADTNDPSIVVAVVLENGGGATEVSGNKLAAPIAREVMRAVLDK
jgi:peptidoglycan glycosyltransferase